MSRLKKIEDKLIEMGHTAVDGITTALDYTDSLLKKGRKKATKKATKKAAKKKAPAAQGKKSKGKPVKKAAAKKAPAKKAKKAAKKGKRN